MRKIALHNSYASAVIDTADYSLVEPHKWCVLRRKYKGKEWTYAVAWIEGRSVLLHRLITGAAKGQMVDHINGDTLDNRRENLRLCTHSENMRNREKSRFGLSGFKGVHKYGNKWRAEIYVDGARHLLGIHQCPEEAAKAYARAAKTLHGEFSRA